MQLRLRNAEKVFELVEYDEAVRRLKTKAWTTKAWHDYWDDVAERRGLTHQARIDQQER